MDEFHRARHEVGNPIHQFSQSPGVGEMEERLVAGRAVAQMKSQLDVDRNGRA
jgi:hypothetical protein